MAAITFETKLYKINDWTILRLPRDDSMKLPSRGQVMVQGTVNGTEFQTPLEPDGDWSHWFRVDDKLAKDAGIKSGDTVSVEIEPIKQWPEPEVPADIRKGLVAHPETQEMWQKITPLARWEWIRWIRGTNQSETRTKRIEVARSKMKSGERRPCCWNRNACSEPAVSKGGVLLGSA
jgi:hypothetical protein